MISLLRVLPSLLRLPLLDHVYKSLSTHCPPTSPEYASAIHILATSPLYDVAYDPTQTKEEMKAEESSGDDLVRVEGEDFVDAIGKAVETYWSACKGKKGKGKGKVDVAVWESFCSWLEEMEEEVEDENLVSIFLFLSSWSSSFINLFIVCF